MLKAAVIDLHFQPELFIRKSIAYTDAVTGAAVSLSEHVLVSNNCQYSTFEFVSCLATHNACRTIVIIDTLSVNGYLSSLVIY